MKRIYSLIVVVVLGIGSAFGQEEQAIEVQDSLFYAYAYFVGEDETLLITELTEITGQDNAVLTENAQKHLFIRKNNVEFLKFIRKNHPDHAAMIRPNMEVIYITRDKIEAEENWRIKTEDADDNYITIYDYALQTPWGNVRKSDTDFY